MEWPPLEGLGTVSYTHLDVYKRQIKYGVITNECSAKTVHITDDMNNSNVWYCLLYTSERLGRPPARGKRDAVQRTEQNADWRGGFGNSAREHWWASASLPGFRGVVLKRGIEILTVSRAGKDSNRMFAEMSYRPPNGGGDDGR